MKERLRKLTSDLMLIPGLSGHEDRVRRALAKELAKLGLAANTDRLGNLFATIEGDPKLPERDAVCPYGPAWIRGAQD